MTKDYRTQKMHEENAVFVCKDMVERRNVETWIDCSRVCDELASYVNACMTIRSGENEMSEAEKIALSSALSALTMASRSFLNADDYYRYF